MAEVTSSPVAPNTGATTSKRKDEVEAAKARLSDQNFNMARYPDPLIPRKVADPQYWPKDVTPEMEESWLAMIREFKEEHDSAY
ncbi:hypothetical protein PT974_08902 [Cladobotryum mycophilum]|uniref:Uncharacterized protein n=1 Tax=Cladobotryum mycophilum TaxID=491253 RepID=A0ABR0SEP0_9HYPO